ncbi:adenosine receptor A1-like [Stylophora pistillata]|uniref:adenosine receptor A1-like n=1 Tax=Stylophora pistillata TaxID=50429 RepID=UPI000C04777E|nr:adenosine receptor A1-like [Stylophora pistillata]
MDPSERGNATFSPNSCLVTFPGDVPDIKAAPAIVSCLVSIISSIFATTGNFLVMWAIKVTPSLHTPSSVFLFILALSDFIVGIFVQPMCVLHLIGATTRNISLYCVTSAMLYPPGVTLVVVSLMTITAITVDRYLALVLHLRYAAIITVSRAIKFNLLFLGICIPCSFYFWFSTIGWYRKASIYFGFILGISGVAAMVFSYYQIFAILRRHKKQILNQKKLATRLHRFSELDISKYRKSVLAVIFVLGAIFFCYLPFGVSFFMAMLFQIEVTKSTVFVTGIMVMLNSSINPLFYCWRITEIRRFAISKLRLISKVSEVPCQVGGVTRVEPVRWINKGQWRTNKGQ